MSSRTMSEDAPSSEAQRLHRIASEKQEAGYIDPSTGLFVLTSFYLSSKGDCCGKGCRHCPYSKRAQADSQRPPVPAYPWPPLDDPS